MEPLHHHFEEMVVYAGNVCSQGGRMNGIRRDELDRGICGFMDCGEIVAVVNSFVWTDLMRAIVDVSMRIESLSTQNT